jgi:hypothetical protein
MILKIAQQWKSSVIFFYFFYINTQKVLLYTKKIDFERLKTVEKSNALELNSLAMRKYGCLMLMHDLYRFQLIEFGVKVLGLEGGTPFQHTGFVFRVPRDGAE